MIVNIKLKILSVRNFNHNCIVQLLHWSFGISVQKQLLQNVLWNRLLVESFTCDDSVKLMVLTAVDGFIEYTNPPCSLIVVTDYFSV